MFNIFNFFGKDESFKWAEYQKIPLSMNMKTESLNDIRIGDLYEKLRVFGRPDNQSPFKDNYFVYYQLGLEVLGSDGRINNFNFEINENVFKEKYRVFPQSEVALTTYNGRQININEHTDLAAIERILGISNEKFASAESDYICAPYLDGRLELEFMFYPDGKIESFSVTSV